MTGILNKMYTMYMGISQFNISLFLLQGVHFMPSPNLVSGP